MRSEGAKSPDSLLQAARFGTGGSAWNEQDEDALLAQGRASAGVGAFFPERVLPQLPDSERLLTGPVRLLDVGLHERIELRRLDVAELDAADEFDPAWLPAPFIPRPALERGLARVAAALRPDGWMLLGHGRLGENAMDAAVTRFKTVAYGARP